MTRQITFGGQAHVTRWKTDMGQPTDLGKASLHAESLEHWFGAGEARVDVLCGVSLHLQPGEITVLMGPSGSGKTVLLALLSGLLRPRAGKVFALGQDIWQMSDSQRRRFRLAHFGFIFQASLLFPGLPGRPQLRKNGRG